MNIHRSVSQWICMCIFNSRRQWLVFAPIWVEYRNIIVYIIGHAIIYGIKIQCNEQNNYWPIKWNWQPYKYSVRFGPWTFSKKITMSYLFSVTINFFCFYNKNTIISSPILIFFNNIYLFTILNYLSIRPSQLMNWPSGSLTCKEKKLFKYTSLLSQLT